MHNHISHAERLLLSLGISTPADIDLEAIAWFVGAKVKYRPLQGCEALIVGNDKNSIISINSRSSPQRKRFSIAHELGHWHHHRGRHLFCHTEDIGGGGDRRSQLERDADRYAADLLMPSYMFTPIVRRISRPSFQSIKDVAALFDTSLVATAIRLVETGIFPCMVICHSEQGRNWFARSSLIPSRWFPQDQLDPASYAFDVLFGRKTDDSMPRKIGADAWFDRDEAQHYEIQEQTIRLSSTEILTLLHVREASMLIER